jgi:hypothetical protein
MRAGPDHLGTGGSPAARAAAQAGRLCPTDYRYHASVFDRPPELIADVLYVAGGLYGNLPALDAIETLAADESGRVVVVLNGDMHWFDAEPGWFAEVERRVSGHPALRGNIETEIARADDVGAGCGCAYPEHVADEVVTRSNAILGELRASAPAALARACGERPMHRVARVGAVRIGIVHGDAEALGGWRFDRAALDDPGSRPWLDHVRAASGVDVFASTHTCTAGLRDLALPGGRLTVVNNGAAGMPNFSGRGFGLVTRIATAPSARALYGLARDGVHIEAVPVRYDGDAFLRRFLARWPAGTAAHLSYFRRLVGGPDDSVAQAQPQG